MTVTGPDYQHHDDPSTTDRAHHQMSFSRGGVTRPSLVSVTDEPK